MVKDYLEKIRQEYIEHKVSLEEQISSYENKVKENTKFLQRRKQIPDMKRSARENLILFIKKRWKNFGQIKKGYQMKLCV